MNRTWWLKVSLVIFLATISFLYLVPSLWNVESFPSWAKIFVPKEKLKLGLDLQGGLHLVMGIDSQKVLVENADLLASDIKEDLQKISKDVQVIREDNSDIRIKFSEKEDVRALRKVISNYQVFEFSEQRPTEFLLRFITSEKQFRIKRAIDQSIEAIRNRIDELGVSEPSIQSEGTERIVVQLPGVQDTERAKEIVGRTAKLEFKLVDESKSSVELENIVPIKFISGKEQKFSNYLVDLNKAMKGKIPEDSQVAFEKKIEPQTQKVTWIPYLLKKKADVTGDYIRDARVFPDPQTNEYKVLLSFNAQGTKPFAKVTKENVGKRLAIVLDGIVHSAPVIQSEIPSGEATITFGLYEDPDKLFKEAQDTALVLRAGALPTTIELLEERTVGPSLGLDSIEAGKKATIIGTLAVMAFMIFYYKLSGVIACLALLLNFPLILSLLAMFGASLTLPGIAGIVLTVGMAVDANVLIFERIREELRLGKNPSTAISLGFEKAWSTIFDANATTLVAALALFSEGTGPIKGFAVTLMIGLCCSVFTAVFVTRLCFEFLLQRLKIAKVSI